VKYLPQPRPPREGAIRKYAIFVSLKDMGKTKLLIRGRKSDALIIWVEVLFVLVTFGWGDDRRSAVCGRKRARRHRRRQACQTGRYLDRLLIQSHHE